MPNSISSSRALGTYDFVRSHIGLCFRIELIIDMHLIPNNHISFTNYCHPSARIFALGILFFYTLDQPSEPHQADHAASATYDAPPPESPHFECFTSKCLSFGIINAMSENTNHATSTKYDAPPPE